MLYQRGVIVTAGLRRCRRIRQLLRRRQRWRRRRRRRRKCQIRIWDATQPRSYTRDLSPYCTKLYWVQTLTLYTGEGIPHIDGDERFEVSQPLNDRAKRCSSGQTLSDQWYSNDCSFFLFLHPVYLKDVWHVRESGAQWATFFNIMKDIIYNWFLSKTIKKY